MLLDLSFQEESSEEWPTRLVGDFVGVTALTESLRAQGALQLQKLPVQI